jgi:hypothetical protein
MTLEEIAKAKAELQAVLDRKYCSDLGEKCALELVSCCRTCNKPDIERVEISVGGPHSLAVWQEFSSDTMSSYFCKTCKRLTMISEAMYCPKCGLCIFMKTEDEEIFGEDEADES